MNRTKAAAFLAMLVAAIGLIAASGNRAAPAAQPADLVLTNGAVFTVDPARPNAQAVAVRGDRIVAVGSSAEMRQWIGPKTRVIDLGGRFAMPGFNDAHTHMAEAGAAKLEVDLTGARSLGEFQQRLRAALPRYKPGQWMVGRGWDHTLWPVKKFPTRTDLDVVSRDRPMFLTRMDGHVAVANSLALRLAGITRSTADPPGGHIVKDPKTNQPDGMLEETAKELVARKIPPPTPAERRHALLLAIADADSHGVTSVSDFSAWQDFLAYRRLRAEGKLTVRITEWIPFELPLGQLEQMRREGGAGDLWLKVGALKGFLDGSFGSETAAMFQPYSDNPQDTGILRMDPKQVIPMTIERDRAGFQINFHAIGDRAVHLGLDAFEAAAKANGPRDRRDRIEHAQVIAPDDFARFENLGVIASMQPCHLNDDVRWATQRLGPERSETAYAWATVLRDHIHFAVGTDYPVERINPMGNLWACVTRQTPQGWPAGGWEPQEKISMADCIRGYTAGSAYAEFEEKDLGELKPGMLADIVVLSRNPLTIAPVELWRTETVLTIAGGRIVYNRLPGPISR
ncbi:MAG TPA: amidohydrolase [Candidatus Acidoferrales bacterium]|nr:amidohydrolase [Candidatus Acidoferrales bacterium]